MDPLKKKTVNVLWSLSWNCEVYIDVHMQTIHLESLEEGQDIS